MWTRKELKSKGKVRFRGNYWKAVLIGLIVLFLTGGSGAASGFSQGLVEGASDSDTEDYDYDYDDAYDEDQGDDLTVDSELMNDTIAMVVFIGILFFIVIIVCIIAIPLQILVFNPLYVGCKRFYIKNLKEDAQVREICYAFDNGYKNVVKTVFFQNLYIFLWTLLFIIPGIVKSYEYQMVPYILAENPGMDRKEVFALSKKMMHGNKWKSFLLDLSFLGWIMLDALTLGILGIFYLNPYMEQTAAALYEKLKEE